MIKNIEETILSFIKTIKQIFNLFISFIPSPLDGIVKTFCIILIVLCMIKLVKLFGNLVGNILGSFIS